MYPNKAATSDVILFNDQNSWKPYIVQDRSETFATWEDGEITPLQVTREGLVYFWQAKPWKTKCPDIQLANFPFDRHICSLSFYIWDNINFTEVTQASIDFSSATMEHSQIHLFDFNMLQPSIVKISFPCGNYRCQTSYISFPIELKRKWFPYYFHGLFLPQFTLSLLQLSAFIIPSDRIERCEFSVTLFVAYAVTRSEVQSYIPKTSETIYIVLATNIAMVGSMLATCYFTICVYLRKTKWFDKKCLVCIDRVIFAIFIIFYIVLYMVTIVSISAS